MKTLYRTNQFFVPFKGENESIQKRVKANSNNPVDFICLTQIVSRKVQLPHDYSNFRQMFVWKQKQAKKKNNMKLLTPKIISQYIFF